MRTTSITLKNYRCLAEAGATIEVGGGITALVGPNNSGKSSFLRMFYELRSLFAGPGSGTPDLQGLFTGGMGAALRDVTDPADICSDRNTRGVTVAIQVAREMPNELTDVQFSMSRDGAWQVSTRQDPFRAIPHGRFAVDRDWNIANQGVGIVGTARPLIETLGALADALYVGPFRNAVSEAQGSHYDLSIGTQFVTTWNAWKTGGNRAQNRTIQQVTETLRKIFSFGTLEINASQDQKTLQVIVDQRPFRLNELGSGLSEFIVVFTNAAIKRPSLILIDEPELHLHPSLQADFVLSLASYAKYGLVFATHSIGLARAVADRVYSFRRNGDAVSVHLFEATPNYAEFLGEMSFSSFQELGYDSILLVEGVSDVKTVQQWLRLFEKEHKVVVIPLGGASLIGKNWEMELGELRRLSGNVSVLFDSERPAEGAPPVEGRVEFAEACGRLGFNACMTQRRALENYLTDRAVKEELGEKYSSLPPFTRLADQQPTWGKSQSWRIARRMTHEELVATEVGTFLRDL